MKKVAILIIITILALSIGFNIYLGNTYSKPYEVVKTVFQNDGASSSYVLSEEEWAEISNDSIFSVIRNPMDWGKIKGCPGFLFEEGNAPLKTKLNEMENPYKNITVRCMDQEQNIKFQIYVLLEKIDGKWFIVGEAKQ